MTYEVLVITHSRIARSALADLINKEFPGLYLEPLEFEWVDGQWSLDCMDPREWCEAMTMD